MPVKELKEFLNSENVRYIAISHSRSYTAQEIAASAHVPGRELAKTVMVTVDGDMAMAVLPASRRVDLDTLKKTTRSAKIALAEESDFERKLPGCETGAMPPFGNLYGMRVFVDRSLTEDAEIAFNAGSHTELIRMRYDDFSRLVKPVVAKFSVHEHCAA